MNAHAQVATVLFPASWAIDHEACIADVCVTVAAKRVGTPGAGA
jgi:hypothetical protein